MGRRPLLLYRSQLLRRTPLLLRVEQRHQLPILVPLPGLSDLKFCNREKQETIGDGVLKKRENLRKLC